MKGKGKHNIVKVGDSFKNTDLQDVTVIKYNNANSIIAVFKHDGIELNVSANSLRRGNFKHPKKFSSLVGQRFKNNTEDWCSIVEYRSAREVFVKFDEYPNNMKKLEMAALRKGVFKNNYKPTIFGKGYLGDGGYKGSKKDGLKDTYNTWINMLARCYDPYTQEKQPAYLDCNVCDEWLCFQNFAEWYVNHESYGLGYSLDKDLLGGSKKLYSPDTCTMLPPELNAMLSGSIASKKGLPVGANKVDNGYTARLNKGKDGREYLGYYKTPEEASAVYIEAKERYVKNKSIEWANRIEWKAFKALMEWEVCP